MKPDYLIERWPNGWLICGAPEVPGVPMDALRECTPLFPKGAHLDPGIAHHYNESRDRRSQVVFALGRPKELAAWRAAITAELEQVVSLELRWWRGLDVGCSAAALFHVLARCESLRTRAWEYLREQAATPGDAADLGRCLRLLALFPDWKARLPEVAEAYSIRPPFGQASWPAIIGRWSELETATPERQTEILRELQRK